MTHGCTLREDNAPCVCESMELSPAHCAYRYDLVNLDEAKALELNQAYSTLRAAYRQDQADA